MSASRDRKSDLLLHLVANLSRPLLLLAPFARDRTAMLRQLQARAFEAWTPCYLLADANLDYARIAAELAQLLRKSGRGGSAVESQASLGEQLAALQHQGRSVLLLLDGAGVVMPGLLDALCQFARLHEGLKLVFALGPEDWAMKWASDRSALTDTYRFAVGMEGGAVGGGSDHELPQPSPPEVPVRTARRLTVAGDGRWAAALAAAVALVAAMAVLRPWRQEAGPAPATLEATENRPTIPVEPAEPPQTSPAAPAGTTEPVATAASPMSVATVPPAESLMTPAPIPQAEPVKAESAAPADRQVPVATVPETRAPAVIPMEAGQAQKRPSPEPVKANTRAGLKDADWVLVQDPSAYTLQLVTLSRLNSLDGYVKQLPPSDQLALVGKGNSQLYFIFYGIYPSAAAARAAIADLPGNFSGSIPRQLKSIQQDIRRHGAKSNDSTTPTE